MTIEDAKVFLDNLKICINEHPVVADWLVEIADRKTEPTCSKMEQVDKPQTDCNGCKFVGTYDTEFPCANCSRKTKDYYAKDEPQTFDDIGRQIQYAYDKGLLSDASAVQAWYEAVKGEQTDCPWK